MAGSAPLTVTESLIDPRILVIDPTRSEPAVVDDETIHYCLLRSESTAVEFASTARIRRYRLNFIETFHRVGCDLIILQYREQEDSQAGTLQRLPAEVPIVVLVDENGRSRAHGPRSGANRSIRST